MSQKQVKDELITMNQTTRKLKQRLKSIVTTVQKNNAVFDAIIIEREKEWMNRMPQIKEDFFASRNQMWLAIGTQRKINSQKIMEINTNEDVAIKIEHCRSKAEGMMVMWKSREETEWKQHQEKLKADWE
ncbi:hypothetical protein CHUAL_010227 [Chamberlinius hualienensis]